MKIAILEKKIHVIYNTIYRYIKFVAKKNDQKVKMKI